ncbi:hypothetical protein MP638_007281 [Amoeboaphelidium occidentale]|nr:hypothetical protein MP638_007281 [Amoeboaphelidium occidentale]
MNELSETAKLAMLKEYLASGKLSLSDLNDLVGVDGDGESHDAGETTSSTIPASENCPGVANTQPKVPTGCHEEPLSVAAVPIAPTATQGKKRGRPKGSTKKQDTETPDEISHEFAVTGVPAGRFKWPTSTVEMLLELRFDEKVDSEGMARNSIPSMFRDNTLLGKQKKDSAWSIIASKLSDDSLSVTPEQCDVKCKNLFKEYRDVCADRQKTGNEILPDEKGVPKYWAHLCKYVSTKPGKTGEGFSNSSKISSTLPGEQTVLKRRKYSSNPITPSPAAQSVNEDMTHCITSLGQNLIESSKIIANGKNDTVLVTAVNNLVEESAKTRELLLEETRLNRQAMDKLGSILEKAFGK